MASSTARHPRTLLIAILLIVSFVLTLIGPAPAGRLRSMVHWALAPFGDAGMYLTTTLKRTLRDKPQLSPAALREQQQELRRLQRSVQSLRSQRRQLIGALQGGQRIFSRLFAPGRDVPVRLIAARVVAADTVPLAWGRLVNVGQRSGVEPGQAATTRLLLTDRAQPLPDEPTYLTLAGEALAGRVVEAGPFTARLQLVNDAGFELPAQVQRQLDPDPAKRRTILYDAREQPLREAINFPVEVYARGDGAGHLVVDEVRASHAIRPGDVLQTRPASLALPAAVTIGTVRAATPHPRHAGVVRLEVTPAADLPTLRDVYIVVPRATLPQGGR